LQTVWIVLFALAAGAAAGFLLGRRNAISGLKALVKGRAEASSPGQLLKTPEQRRGAAQAYLDVEAAERSFGRYAWDVPVTALPFVGFASTPSTSPHLGVNRHHFRASREVETPKPAGRFRIFLTGGSAAFGAGAPDFAHSIGGFLETILRRKLPGVEVFTVASPAWAGVHERIMVENRLFALEPDLIVSCSGNNDPHWAWNGKDILWFRTYAETHFWKLLNKAYELAGSRPMAETLAEKKPVEDAEAVSRLVRHNVSLSLRALKPLATPYVYFLQPTMPVSKKKLSAREKERFAVWHPAQIAYFRDCYRHFRRDLTDLAQAEPGFTFVDMSTLFDDKTASDELFLDAYHFGDKGYRAIAEKMAERLDSFVPEA